VKEHSAGASDQKLSGLLAAYREACPEPEPNPEFMPGLWRRIEARQTFVFTLRRLSRALITAAAIASLAMGVYITQFQRIGPTYLEQIAGANTPDNLADTEIVQALYEHGNKR
jgi:hypothetical protein